jgi:uncharacterized membrane protein YccC
MKTVTTTIRKSYRNAWALSALTYKSVLGRNLFRFAITGLPFVLVLVYLVLGLSFGLWAMMVVVTLTTLLAYPAVIVQFFHNSGWIIKMYEENRA